MSSGDSQFRYLSQLMDGIVTDIGRFLDHLPVAGFILNRDGTVLVCNERAANFLTIDSESHACSGSSIRVSPSCRADLAAHLNEVITNKEEHLLDIRILLDDGQEIPARLVSKSLTPDSDLCLSILIELEYRKDHVRILSHLAYYDALTGLPNRLLFNDRLRWAISDARRRKEQLAVMLIDLDDFKNVNDTLGHSAGDQVLKAVSARMLACLRETDTLSRLGGDEFTVLMQHVVEVKDAAATAYRLLDTIRQPFEIQDTFVTVTGSIGICLYPDDGDLADTLIRNADIAMYRSKSSGKNRVAFFNESMRDSVDRKNDLERRLRKAIQERRLNLHYQPIVHSSTKKIIGLEALLRWDSGNEGVLPAGQFIQIAEKLGLCSIFSDWALLTAGQQLGKWMDNNLISADDDFRLSINVCADQLADPEFPSRIGSVLDQNNLPPSLLALDLAEEVIQLGNSQAKINMLKLA